MHCYIQPGKAEANSRREYEEALVGGQQTQKDRFAFEEEVASREDSLQYAQNKVPLTVIVEFSLISHKSSLTSLPTTLPNFTKALIKLSLTGYFINVYSLHATISPKSKTFKPVYGRASQTTLTKESSSTLQVKWLMMKNFGLNLSTETISSKIGMKTKVQLS